jgi:hypothetical protein
MPSKKTNYSIQVVAIVAVFAFVLFNLIFKLIVDYRADSIKKQAGQIEKDRIKHEFIVNIDEQYKGLLKLYQAKEYDKAIEIIKVFNKYEKSDYKDLPEMKKEIRLFSLKKKMDFIPKIHLNEFMKLSKDIEIEEDDTIEVFIRTPRYGQYFYISDLPVTLEGIALSLAGDFSDKIVWVSDRDGELGIGTKLIVNLSIGDHNITATGSNGVIKGDMVTRIYIEKEPDFLKSYRKD